MVIDLATRGAFVMLDEWSDLVAVFTAAGQNTPAFRRSVWDALRAGWRPPAERVLPRWPEGATPTLVVGSAAQTPSPSPSPSPKDEVPTWA